MTLTLPDRRPIPARTLTELRTGLLATLETPRRPLAVPGLLRRAAGPVFVMALLAHGVTVALWPAAHLKQIDLEVYRAGGATLLAGEQLYDGGVLGFLPFTYPPIAAVLFGPLALLPLNVARALMMLANLGLLVFAVRRCWRHLGALGADLRALTLLGAGAAFWLEPVRTTVYLGQINLLLLAMVAWDLLRPNHRWKGIGVGLAAGIKLTPLMFVPYLLLTRRFREALVASTTFAGTVLVGSALSPANSRDYWLHGTFTESSRVGSTTAIGNQSLRGTLARWLGEAAHVPWVSTAAIVGLAALLVAAAAHRRGHELLGMAITGLTAAAVSPFSWPHHWVWFVPLAAVLAAGRAWVALLALSSVTLAFVTDLPRRSGGAIPGTGVISIDPPGVLGWLCHNVYPVTFVVITAITAVWMACNADRRIGYLPA